jgi:endoglucanase
LLQNPVSFVQPQLQKNKDKYKNMLYNGIHNKEYYMKKILSLSLVFFFLLFSCNSTEKSSDNEKPQAAIRSAPFSKGVNFSAWFESHSAESIPFTKYTEQDFADAKSMGADVIRLPVRLHSMTSGEPDFLLDPLLVRFLNTAVDWAEKHELYIIIDNHSFDPVIPTSPDIERILLPVWRQIAELFKNRSDYVIYEILNEPHGISDALWGAIQGRAIDVIRSIDQSRLIIVGGTDYNSIGKLFSLPRYSDPNLIYTFHFYDPYLFTHQGATWGGPPLLTNLRELPFPARGARMPRLSADLIGTWVESSLLNNYSREASYAALNRTLDRVVAFSLERDVPVFCGEFGVYMINSNNEDRVRWYRFVSEALDLRNISRTSWDYYGGFGIFNSDRGKFNHDLNVDIVRAMGFTPPVQIPRNEGPINTGFVIYDDYPNYEYVSAGVWGDNVIFSLYDNNSVQGEFAIRWGNAERYNAFYFVFYSPDMDFTNLVRGGYFLEFKARTGIQTSFDIRFLNSESQSSIPWRMRYTIDERSLPPDDRWHTIRIPLSSMSEHGAWLGASSQWLEPRGNFSWRNVSRIEFVAEHSDINGIIRFDDIKITR